MGFVLEICDVKNTQGNSHKVCVCVCHHTGYHPQEELAKFGYRSERKVEIKKKSCLSIGDLLKLIFLCFLNLKIW
jgi:hypothetical protein